MTVDTNKQPIEPQDAENPSDAAQKQPSKAPADYEVGYRKPPQATRFKKGHSGNPRGIRKPMTAAETAAKVLSRTMTISENGRKRRATVQEGILLAQADRAAKGDPKSAKMLFGLNDRAPPPPKAYSMVDMENDIKEAIKGFTIEQVETIADFQRRMAAIQNMRGLKRAT